MVCISTNGAISKIACFIPVHLTISHKKRAFLTVVYHPAHQLLIIQLDGLDNQLVLNLK
jgi:hypothetical protein